MRLFVITLKFNTLYKQLYPYKQGFYMHQIIISEESEDKPENHCPEQMQTEDTSILQTKLLGKVRCKQHFLHTKSAVGKKRKAMTCS